MEEDMRKVEITKDLDSYLSSRRRRPIKDTIKDMLQKKERRPVAEEMPVEQVKAVIEGQPIKQETMDFSVFVEEKSFFGKYLGWLGNIFYKDVDAREIEKIEREAREVSIQEESEEPQGPQEEPPERKFFWNFFANLFKKKTGYETPEESDIDEETDVKKLILERPEVEKDMKQMALVTQEILKRLPPGELQNFKNSIEFEIYKDVLKRYNLIKEEKK